MIRIRHVDGQAAPLVTCDHCGYAIESSETAWYQWLEGLDGPVTGQIFFLHKRCVDAFEREHPEEQDQLWANMELTYFPVFLGNCLNVDWYTAFDGTDSVSKS